MMRKALVTSIGQPSPLYLAPNTNNVESAVLVVGSVFDLYGESTTRSCVQICCQHPALYNLTKTIIRSSMKANLDECWLWAGYMTRRANGEDGYGYIYSYKDGKQTNHFAHRVVYESTNGRIESGMVLDHLCRVTRCVNPDHLEVVSQKQNVARGEGVAKQKSLQTHCIHGHEFDTKNTGRNKNGTRYCKKCTSIKVTRLKRAKRLNSI
jgi:hypothetical protein